jgi:hypothetical protein
MVHSFPVLSDWPVVEVEVGAARGVSDREID